MALRDVETALFELCFDARVRDLFVRNPHAAFEHWATRDLVLEPSEKEDLLCIQPDGLVLDARLRMDTLLHRFVRSYPLTVRAISVSKTSRAQLERPIRPDLLLLPPADRIRAYGMALHHAVDHARGWLPPASVPGVMMVLEWELALADMVRHAKLTGDSAVTASSDGPWELSPLVRMVRFPWAHTDLQHRFAPADPEGVVAALNTHPMDMGILRDLADAEPGNMLLLARAQVVSDHPVERDVRVDLMEVPALMQHVFPLVRQGRAGAHQTLQRAGVDPAALRTVDAILDGLVARRILVALPAASVS